jgi:anti-sigma B factor antagonist
MFGPDAPGGHRERRSGLDVHKGFVLAARVRPHPFEVSVDDLGRVTVVRVQGEVDAATAPRVGEAVNRLLGRKKRVVLDLRDVDFMDLHGLGVLLRATRRARGDGGSIAIARPSSAVRRLIELVHAENELRVLADGTDPRDAA